MSMKHVLMIVAAPVAFVASAASAQAAILTFNLTGSYVAKFDLDTELLAPPAEIGSDYFIVENIAGTFAGVDRKAESITFNTNSSSGGLTIQLGSDFVGLLGPALFGGTTTAPIFSPGNFVLTSDADETATSRLSISAATSAVPEPSSWTLMLAGFSVTGLALRRRVRVAYAA